MKKSCGPVHDVLEDHSKMFFSARVKTFFNWRALRILKDTIFKSGFLVSMGS